MGIIKIFRILFNQLLLNQMSKALTSIILALALLFGTSNNGCTQIKTHGIPYIKNYTIDDYKGNEFGTTQNWYIFQDSKGLMYFANSGGLLYFDGVNWSFLDVEETSTFRSICGTDTDKIFAGGKGEFGFLTNDSIGNIRYQSLIGKIPEGNRSFTDVWNIYTFSDKVIFETGKKLFIYKNDSIYIVKTSGSILNTFKINEELYVVNTEKGLQKLTGNKLTSLFQHQIFDSYLFVVEGFNESSLIISRNHGFYELKDESLKKWNVDFENILINKKPYCGVKLDNEHIAIGTQLGGIFIINSKGKVEQVYNKHNGLQANTVYNLYLDKDKNLWAALGNGISYLKINSPFTYFNPLLNIPRKNYDVQIVNSKLYFSNEVGVHYKPIASVDNNLASINFKLIDGISGISYKMLKQNNLLIVANSYGIYLVENNKVISKAIDGIHFWDIQKIPEKTNTYYGMSSKGLYTFEVDQKKIKKANKVDNCNYALRYSAVENATTIWTTDEVDGLKKLILSKDLKRVDSTSTLKFGKEKMLVFPFILDQQVYVTSNTNLFKIESDHYIVAKDLKEKYNLKDDAYWLQKDKWKRIWIQSNTRVKWISPDKKIISKPFKPLVGENISRMSIISKKDIYFPTDKFVIHYNPTYPFYEDANFNVVFHSIKNLNNDSIIAGMYGHIFQDSLTLNLSGSTIILPYNKNNLRFSYAATYYEKPEETKYQIWLDGSENNNMNWTKETHKDYTNLKPGKYIFHVKAKNIYENISNEKTISFEITPPFYLSIWAYLIYSIIGVIIFYLILRLYTRQLKARNIKLEFLVRERTQEIETQNEEILSQSEQLMEYNEELRKLSVVASEVNNAIFITDHLGNIEWVNEGFQRVYGQSFYDVKQKNRASIFSHSNSKYIEHMFEDVRNSKQAKTFEQEVVTKNGKRTYVNTTLTPLLNPDHIVDKIVAIDSDITELKQAENEILQQKEKILIQNEELSKHRHHLEELVKERTEELQKALSRAEESDRLKSSFLMNMSHEIRTPMNAIMGFCEILGSEEDPENCHNHIQQITSNSNILLQLIDNIINLSRLESESYELTISEFDLNKLVNQLYSEHIDRFKQKNIVLTMSKSQLKPMVTKTDQQLVFLTFNQLIQNAFKYTSEGEVIFGYKMKQINDQLQMICFVKDTGIGMNEEDINMVFKRFTKIEDNNKKLYRGAGIGLALCQRTIQLLSGKIWIESEVEKGTTVSFTFSDY